MGAVRSFWDNYQILRQSNIAPTKKLIELAAVRRVPIHCISTAGVIPGESAGSAPASVADHKSPVDGSQGYIASRWACEQLLSKVAAQEGVPVSIHRFVPAKRASTESTVPALEHFTTFVDSLSVLPDLNGVKGHFEMTPVGKAAGKAAGTLANALIANAR